MKSILKITAVLIFYYLIGTATSTVKDLDYPCAFQLNNFLSKDTFVRSYYSSAHNDTIVISAFKDSLWESKSLAICKLLKDSCNISGYKILVMDTTNNLASWNTPYGKQIYLHQCP